MSEHFDCAVVGAGVVGLAVARRLALTGRSVIVLERNDRIGAETSSRNSEVIHAGLYYPANSLKARLCVHGKMLLYDYLRTRELPHRVPGKLIVAVTNAERDKLGAIEASAAANGVHDLERLDQRALAQREPAVRGCAALWSPSTGIVDSHALMLSMQADIEAADGIIALDSTVLTLAVTASALRLDIASGDESLEISATTVVNAAGLGAVPLAAASYGCSSPPRVRYAKGNYFVLQGASPFQHLIYPLPVDGGLGIHATLDLAGHVRFGPDVEWIDTIDYALDMTRAADFYAAIRSYWPELPDGRLSPGYTGIRPKLSAPGEPVADFSIVDSAPASRARLIQLFGIESPGLTSCLAIADYVADMLKL